MGKNKEKTTIGNSKTPLFISLGILLGLVGLYFISPAFNAFIQEAWATLSSGDDERIEQWVSRFGWYGPLLLVLAKILQLFAVIIPTVAMIVVAVLAYGPLWGGLLAMAAVFIAATVAYLLGAYFGPAILHAIMGAKSREFMYNLIEDYGFRSIGAVRINPLFSGDAISFIAGILKMNYWRFIGATMAGATPLIGFVAWIGRDNNSLLNGLIWASALGLLSFAAYVWWDKKRKNNEDKKEEEAS